jgi:uncharacterized protein YyaL (SSP411 family)
MPANHLLKETSPYLQQHIQNPVDWYPWGKEALEKARRENKPILLSIGYSACHWCHVMAHESFENQETAKLMNQHFVNIKVDREERPDLDKIYQMTHSILTQHSGGWPLTVFLDPNDLTPFYSGTYFPNEARFNLPSFQDLLRTIANLFEQHPNEIAKQNAVLRKALNENIITESIILNKKPIDLANKTLENRFDATHGGFGNAPKFPHPSQLIFLLQEQSPLASFTLQQMANGGIYDQLSGGFFRYTIDAEWQIPHFEKMLYDNAQLLYLYSEAYRRYSQPFFAEIARQTAQWILENMQDPDGGYYSSLDADSDHEEGKYYIWNKFEIDALLTKEESQIIRAYYGLNNLPNFEKHWHLYVTEPLDAVASQFGLSPNQAKELLLSGSGNQKLLTSRKMRPPPHCDKKIITAWNSLMIKALMTAGDDLKENTFIHSAERALDFIHKKLWVNQRLFATYKDQQIRFLGYLDDYAFLLDALLTVLQTRWKTKYIEFAIVLAHSLLTRFCDEKSGGFYFTAHDHEELIHRPKTFIDEAVPSGNGIAARALLVLGYLLGEPLFIQAAEKTIQASWPILSKYPSEQCSSLLALEYLLDPPQIVIIRGSVPEMNTWETFCKKQLNTLVFAIPNSEHNLPGLLAAHKGTDKTCAYLCKGTQCLAEIQDFEELQHIISKQTKD